MLIIAVEFIAIFQLAVFGYGVYLLQNTNEISYAKLSDAELYTYITIFGVYNTFVLFVAVTDAHLIAFHIWLRCHQLTTYEYIIQIREKGQNTLSSKLQAAGHPRKSLYRPRKGKTRIAPAEQETEPSNHRGCVDAESSIIEDMEYDIKPADNTQEYTQENEPDI